MYSTEDFCSFVGDGGKLYPNEISLQQGTPTVGSAYLAMYKLEPNPIYLELAKGAGDALIYAQLEDGGFYKYAQMDEHNQSSIRIYAIRANIHPMMIILCKESCNIYYPFIMLPNNPNT